MRFESHVIAPSILHHMVTRVRAQSTRLQPITTFVVGEIKTTEAKQSYVATRWGVAKKDEHMTPRRFIQIYKGVTYDISNRTKDQQLEHVFSFLGGWNFPAIFVRSGWL